MTNVAFILSAIGANVVWLISLYSYLTFAVARRSWLKDSAASALTSFDSKHYDMNVSYDQEIEVGNFAPRGPVPCGRRPRFGLLIGTLIVVCN